MNDHVIIPVTLPDLSSLSDEQIAAFRSKVTGMVREYRRKANTSISKIGNLQKSWTRMLGMNGATPEEDRREIQLTFERELLLYPATYLDHAIANALVLLDATCREEGLRRSPAGVSAKKR